MTRPAVALADTIARRLAAAGTRVVYGVPGGGNNLEVVGACERAGLRFVLAHGESSAAIMAGVDGELTRAPGACVVTRGPGVASAVNGVAHAMLDRQPMLLISDAIPFADRLRISHQRLDQDALLAPVTKWSVSVGVDGAEEAIDAAIRIASRPPRGPVHVAFVPDAPRPSIPPTPPEPPRGDLPAAARLLASSRRPVFALGVGALACQVAAEEPPRWSTVACAFDVPGEGSRPRALGAGGRSPDRRNDRGPAARQRRSDHRDRARSRRADSRTMAVSRAGPRARRVARRRSVLRAAGRARRPPRGAARGRLTPPASSSGVHGCAHQASPRRQAATRAGRGVGAARRRRRGARADARRNDRDGRRGRAHAGRDAVVGGRRTA